MSVQEYEAQLSEQEKEVLAIARDHLGDSFDMERSLGYRAWVESRPTLRPVPRAVRRKVRVRRRRDDAAARNAESTAGRGASTG